MEKAGQINAYTCIKCGEDTVTVNRDEGVTPFIIGCRAGFPDTCNGEARSQCYNVSQALVPTHVWYRPDEAETKRLEKRHGEVTGEHIRQGGLWLRAKGPNAPPGDAPPTGAEEVPYANAVRQQRQEAAFRRQLGRERNRGK